MTTTTSLSTSTTPRARCSRLSRLARMVKRADLLDATTVIEDGVRRFSKDASIRRLGRAERAKVVAAFHGYLETIPESKRFDRALFYDLRDIVGKSGFGIGSAGLPAYNLLVEGYSQALDNDVVLSMKQANVPALSRFVDSRRGRALLRPRGSPHRGEPARAAGAHRPAARPHRARRRRLRGLGGLALRGRPGLGRHQRARRDRGGGGPARAGHRQDPLRLGRGQRAGPRRLPGRGGDLHAAGGATQGVHGVRRGLRARLRRSASERTTPSSSRPSARAGSGSRRPDPAPRAGSCGPASWQLWPREWRCWPRELAMLARTGPIVWVGRACQFVGPGRQRGGCQFVGRACQFVGPGLPVRGAGPASSWGQACQLVGPDLPVRGARPASSRGQTCELAGQERSRAGR